MSESPLQSIMNPRSIVIAGASNNFMKMGSIQSLNLLHSKFAGEVVFLHPTERTVLGREAYKTPADLPFVPDLAFLITPTQVTLDLLNKLGERGVRRAVIVTAGFREIGPEGAKLEDKLREIADKHQIRFVGPNCIGAINTHNGLNLTVLPYKDRPGKLGLVSQSGTYVAQILPYLRENGIRYSQAISVGNATNIDLVDCLEYLGDDPKTKAIAIYTEGIRRGRRFVEVARRISRKKPIVALYVGGTSTGSRSCLSHTGSLGGPDRLYDGIYEQSGVIRASTIRELYNWGNALANMPPPRGDRMGILTHSGGPATSMADACERNGLELPVFSDALQAKIKKMIEPTASAKNPVDLTFSMDHDTFITRLPELLLGSDEIDGLMIYGMMDTAFMIEMYDTLEDRVTVSKEEFIRVGEFKMDKLLKLPAQNDKPLVCATFLRNDHAAQTFRDNDIPLLYSPEEAVAAMAALRRYARLRDRIPATEAPDQQPTPPRIESLADKGVIDEHQAKNILALYGVPLAKEKLVEQKQEALLVAAEIGYPVALKGIPEGTAHKTEAGLVQLDLRNDAELAAAWDKIETAAPGCPRLVAQMLVGGPELVVGMSHFTGFGPCVMLGIGGIYTEAIDDAVFRMAPVSSQEAELMQDSLKLSSLLEAQRGRPAVDRAALAEVIVAVSRLAQDHPEIKEIDINPLICVNGKPIAVDALIVAE